MPESRGDLANLFAHVRSATRQAYTERMNWLRAASRIPRSSYLSVRATIIGTNFIVGEHSRIEELVRIQCGSATRPHESIYIGNHSSIRPHAQIYSLGGSVTIGSRCSVNPHCVLYGTGGLRIGNHVRIAAHTVVVAAMHRFDRTDVPIHEQGSTASGIVIEDDVWVGAGVTILDGVRIGTGAIIAAGAVVLKDVESMTIVGGIPARTIRRR